jgi:hypothetical protein
MSGDVEGVQARSDALKSGALSDVDGDGEEDL